MELNRVECGLRTVDWITEELCTPMNAQMNPWHIYGTVIVQPIGLVQFDGSSYLMLGVGVARDSDRNRSGWSLFLRQKTKHLYMEFLMDSNLNPRMKRNAGEHFLCTRATSGGLDKKNSK